MYYRTIIIMFTMTGQMSRGARPPDSSAPATSRTDPWPPPRPCHRAVTGSTGLREISLCMETMERAPNRTSSLTLFSYNYESSSRFFQ